MSKFLGIIPARKGSKGIKNKNRFIVNGKPLIAYTIIPSLKSELDEVIVSTNCEIIRQISINYGANAPFLRPDYLSTDSALTVDVVKHALEYYEKEKRFFDYIFLLQPTCPLRSKLMINQTIKTLKENKEYDSALSVVDVQGNHPARMKKIVNGNLVNFDNSKKEDMRPRQELPKVYLRSGSIYAIKVETFKKNNSLVGNKVYPIIEKPEDTINIDSPHDLELFIKLLS